MKVTLIRTWNIANNLHIWGISRVELVLCGEMRRSLKLSKIKFLGWCQLKDFPNFFSHYIWTAFLCQCVCSEQHIVLRISKKFIQCFVLCWIAVKCSIFIIYLSNKQFPTKFEILFVSSIPRLHAIISLRKMQHSAATTVPVLVHIFPN